jgi:hypothetical protein
MANSIGFPKRYVVGETSSMYRNAIGKFTDSNHLYSLYMDAPERYDRDIIELFNQTKLYSNDFLNLISAAEPFYLTTHSDSFTYKIRKGVEYPKIIENLASAITKPGVQGTMFSLVFDRKVFVHGDRITAHRIDQGVQLVVAMDPVPYGKGHKYTFTVTGGDTDSFVPARYLQPGVEYFKIDNIIGEFDTKLSGLGLTDGELEVMHTLGESFGVEHTVTEWAEMRQLVDANGKKFSINLNKDREGNAKDITFIGKTTAGRTGKEQLVDLRWAKTIDLMLKKEMLDMKVNKLIWGRSGVVPGQTGQSNTLVGAGLYEQMEQGNVVYYNRGEFGVNLLRTVFGDMFYRRKSFSERKVMIYTNEAGMDLINNTLQKELFNTGFRIDPSTAGMLHGISQNKPSMNLGLGYAFDHFITTETGEVSFKHMPALDDPMGNMEYGPGKKSAPMFMVFDVSTEGDATAPQRIREIRHKGAPSMTWGYEQGTVSPFGFGSMQGMQSAHRNPWYTMWMKDRVGIFLEDPSRTVIIKEQPQVETSF